MISCKEYVEIQKKELKDKISSFRRKPCLCVVQIGDNQASNSYIKSKKNMCDELGIEFKHVHITNDIGQEELENKVFELSLNYNIDGVIIQLPIPNKYNVDKLQQNISVCKDVDGFRGESLFSPCTPLGIIEWLKYNGFDFIGKNVVVVGRSKIVGLPLTEMLIKEGATVTCCNSSTNSLSRYMFNADLVITAIGKPKFFNKFDFNGTKIIVDVGINRDENGKLCGDVDPCNLEEYTGAYLTPVPGGVGKLTVLSLMKNVVEAYEIFNS